LKTQRGWLTWKTHTH